MAFVVALAIAPFLPVYFRRSMTRSFRSEGGDAISWDWDFTTLPGFVDKLRYMRPEDSKYLYLALNLALFATIAALLTLTLAALLRRLARKRQP